MNVTNLFDWYYNLGPMWQLIVVCSVAAVFFLTDEKRATTNNKPFKVLCTILTAVFAVGVIESLIGTQYHRFTDRSVIDYWQLRPVMYVRAFEFVMLVAFIVMTLSIRYQKSET